MSVIQQHHIHLILVVLDVAGLVSMPGFEQRPADTSLPVMRIEKNDGSVFWIHESLAILEYFEEIFPPSAGYPNLLGFSSEERARTRDILSLTTDAILWSGIELMHSNPATTSWSGLTVDEMSSSAAAQAARKFDMLLTRLERWVEEAAVQDVGTSIAGAGASVTMADIVLMAQVEYIKMCYGTDWLSGHDVLRRWYDTGIKARWYVGTTSLRSVEMAQGWGLVL